MYTFLNFSFKTDSVLLIKNHYLCENKFARQTLVNAIRGENFS